MAVRRTRLLGLGAIALVVLVGCTPIHYDGTTGTTTSRAEWRVAPVATSAGPGIEVRMRNCDTVVLTEASLEQPITWKLRPVVVVTDAEGTVIFSNASPISAVLPEGYEVVNGAVAGGLHRVIVPTASAIGALTIEPTCTSYQGYGQSPAFSFDFQPCTTSTRSCSTRTAGVGTFRG